MVVEFKLGSFKYYKKKRVKQFEFGRKLKEDKSGTEIANIHLLVSVECVQLESFFVYLIEKINNFELFTPV